MLPKLCNLHCLFVFLTTPQKKKQPTTSHRNGSLDHVANTLPMYLKQEQKRNIAQLSKQLDTTYTKWDRLYGTLPPPPPPQWNHTQLFKVTKHERFGVILSFSFVRCKPRTEWSHGWVSTHGTPVMHQGTLLREETLVPKPETRPFFTFFQWQDTIPEHRIQLTKKQFTSTQPHRRCLPQPDHYPLKASKRI